MLTETKTLREKQKENVQKLVISCLEKKQSLFQQRKCIEESMRVLNMVLEDLKEGRLDRIVEMQEKDPTTIYPSGFRIQDVDPNPLNEKGGKWYKPYLVTIPGDDGVSICEDRTHVLTVDEMPTYTHQLPKEPEIMEINCSSTKDHAVGTYIVGNKKEVIHFRK